MHDPILSPMARLRNYFLTGLVVCAPLAITAYLAWSFIGWVDGCWAWARTGAIRMAITSSFFIGATSLLGKICP